MKLRALTFLALWGLSIFGGCSSSQPYSHPSTAIPHLDPWPQEIVFFKPWKDFWGSKHFWQPLLSKEEMYGERWDLLIYAHPYKVRVKFDITNMGPGSLKGRLNAYLEKKGKIEVKKNFDQGAWSAAQDRFQIKMGDFEIFKDQKSLILRGLFQDQEVEIKIQGQAWTPGTGWVLIPKSSGYYRYDHLSTLGQVQLQITRGEQKLHLSGKAFGAHTATNVGIHEWTRHTLYFRHLSEDRRLLIEWRAFGLLPQYGDRYLTFLVVSYDGVIVFQSVDAQLKVRSLWKDPKDRARAAIPSSFEIRAREGKNQALFLFQAPTEPQREDPLAKLSAIERMVAKQIVSPMNYNFRGPWRLDLQVDGISSTIRDGQGQCSVKSYH